MKRHPCIAAGLYGFALSFACMAFAQDPTDPLASPVAALPPDLAIATLVLQYAGLPGVIGFGLYKAATALSGIGSWSPTITIRIVQVEQPDPKTSEVPRV